MADMSAEELSQLADRIRQLLEEFGMEVQEFNLKISVTPVYYETIRENFPDRHPIDLIVGSRGRKWSIELLKGLPPLSVSDKSS